MSVILLFSYGACSPIAGYGLLILEVFRDHTQRHTTVGRTPLDEWSARRRDLYLTTHNTQTSMPPAGFEPTISAGERPQTYALDRAATGTGKCQLYQTLILKALNVQSVQMARSNWTTVSVLQCVPSGPAQCTVEFNGHVSGATSLSNCRMRSKR